MMKMRKFLLLIFAVMSLTVFGTSKTEGLEKKVTSKINFFMSREELENAIQKKAVGEQNGIVYYENVQDPIGLEQELASFIFIENDMISSVFSRPTDLQEHKKILNQYREYFKNVPKNKLTKIENLKANAILYYNDRILLTVRHFKGQTLITEQLYDPELLNYRIEEIKNLKE